MMNGGRHCCARFAARTASSCEAFQMDLTLAVAVASENRREEASWSVLVA
eukprot:CAMPEP_0206567454 /NCGR_PEP_ID=MMETSP0325_2-20121206/25252_1 /ASSEMBLY_ACC=CAM_ASM_000347 /TAXON_ID=2866 /ORGANISM="Crypthecodinium cohnii, Strain Seligo" /LENGTH=49 /DNA_ID=CAMNT_0054070655 /DNA_START=263 /DNA_END=412 /DNA_ORIENTATION=+